MAAKIESILDAKMYVVRTNDDRDGEQMHVVAYMPHTGRAIIVQSGKMADLRAGGGPFKALSMDLEQEFIARIEGKTVSKPSASAKKPAKRGK